MAWAMDYSCLCVLRKRSLCQWMFQIMGFLFIVPGGAVSQFPPPEGEIFFNSNEMTSLYTMELIYDQDLNVK